VTPKKRAGRIPLWIAQRPEHSPKNSLILRGILNLPQKSYACPFQLGCCKISNRGIVGGNSDGSQMFAKTFGRLFNFFLRGSSEHIDHLECLSDKITQSRAVVLPALQRLDRSVSVSLWFLKCSRWNAHWAWCRNYTTRSEPTARSATKARSSLSSVSVRRAVLPGKMALAMRAVVFSINGPHHKKQVFQSKLSAASIMVSPAGAP
jgi:hypothetical protein